MVAAQKDWEEQPLALVTPPDAATGEPARQTELADVHCSEDGSRCLSREERRAIGRQVIAERQRAFALLDAYDSHQ